MIIRNASVYTEEYCETLMKAFPVPALRCEPPAVSVRK